MEVRERFFALSVSLSFILSLAIVDSLWAGDIRFSWQAPTTNEDGTPLTDLNNYRVHYGTVSRGSQTNPASFQYQSSTTIPASPTSYTLTGLTTGQRYYISVTAIDTAGNQSKYSINEVNAIAQDSSSGGTLPLLANFSSGAQGFTYSDLTPSIYANGQVSNGALQITLGGVDNTTVTNMAGGWSWTFNLPSAATVTITFRYNLTQTSEYEAGECSEVRAVLNEVFLPSGGYVDRVCGNGNGGTAISTGWKTFTTTTGSLAAGITHTLRLEGYNSQKTYNDESTTVLFDDVDVRTGTPPPVAAFTASPTSGTAPLTVSFADTSSGSISSRSWAFGNGGSSTSTNPSYTYTTAGTYIVTLTVTGPGGSNQASQTITVTASGVGTLPLLANFSNGAQGFTYSDLAQNAYANGQVSNGALQLTLGGADNATVTNIRGGWSWAFMLQNPAPVTITFRYNLTQTSEYEAGECSEVRAVLNEVFLPSGGYVDRVCGNGNGGTAISTGWKTFTTTTGSLAAGITHTLRLEGYNSQKTYNDESTTVLFDDVDVRTGTPPPVAAFTASPTSGTAPLTVSFADTSSGSISSRSWAFGNGGSSTSTNPSYTYTTAGTYIVTLTVTGPGGSNQASQTITVTASGVGTPPLLADFSNGAQGFTYSDLAQNAYANGQVSNGALQLTLGGADNATVTNIRGGWSWAFMLQNPAPVTITFRYNLTQTSEYEAGECSEVRAVLNEVFLPSGGYVDRVCGNGNGGTAISTGWKTFTTTTGSLAAGITHTLRLEGYNSQKTYNDESTTVLFDDVDVRTGGAASATAPAPVQLWLEAESGQLASPMATGNDGVASGGQYVWAPESVADVGSATQSGGTAQYTVSVTTADTYVIWARVYPSADGSGAFYLQMDSDPYLTWDIPFPAGGGTAGEEAVSITSPTNYDVTTLHVGDAYYIDRTYTITALPPALNGLVAIKTANADRSNTSTTFLTLNLDEDATLYVAYDSRANPFPTWLTANYTSTGLTISTSDAALSVWEHQVSAGTVTLPGNMNGNPGGVGSNYIVLLEFQGGGGPTWRWYQAAQDTTPVFSLTSGAHTLTFKHRWSGTRLDRLLITNDLDFVPAN